MQVTVIRVVLERHGNRAEDQTGYRVRKVFLAEVINRKRLNIEKSRWGKIKQAFGDEKEFRESGIG